MLKKAFNQLRPFLEPGTTPILFIFGAILLGVISNAVYASTNDLLGAPGLVLLSAIGFLIVLVLAYMWIPRIFKPKLIVSDVEPRRGLIVLVSQGQLSKIPASVAICHHLTRLEHCWLVTSPQPSQEPARPGGPGQSKSEENTDVEPHQSAWKNTQDLMAKLKTDTRSFYLVEVDPENPGEIYKKIGKVYRDARSQGLKAHEIITDFTGGTKIMTAGMILACTSLHYQAEYVKPRRYLPDGRADPKAGADPKLVDLSFLPEISARILKTRIYL